MTTGRIVLKLSLAAAMVLLAARSEGQGSIGFLTTQSEIVAGNSYTGLPLGLDWNAPQTVDPPGAWVAGQHPVFALPADRQDITVRTWSDSSGLKLRFQFDDATRVRSSKSPHIPGGMLQIGDKIVIVLDPNQSRETELQNGGGSATDYRFDITIKNNAIVSQHSIPLDSSVPPLWDDSSGTNVTIATLTSTSGNQYTVDIAIPYSTIGLASMSNDIGIAFAVVNDLGFTYGNPAVSDLTGVTFPHTMGLDEGSEPGFVLFTGTSTGNWTSPAQWGTGFAKQSTVDDIHFSHSPQYVWSDSIKLGVCNTPTWDSVEASGVWTNQLTLQGWYEYYSGNPCQMKVWLKVKKTQPGASSTRILVVWGRPGIGGSQDWHVVDLTPTISVAPPFHILSLTWPDPPAEPYTLTNHPCLKVIALPGTLDGVWDEARIRTIASDADLQSLLSHYHTAATPLVGYSARTAQMNFTAVAGTGNCTEAGCISLTSHIERPWQWLTSLLTPQPVLGSASSHYAVSAPVARSQPRVDDRREPYKGRPFPAFHRVTAVGIGVTPLNNPKKQYRFLQNLGGIGWAIPDRNFGQSGKMAVAFQVMNPALFIPVQTKGGKVVDMVRSPIRDVYLSVAIDSPKKRVRWFPFITKEARAPRTTVRFRGTRMEPGQYADAVIVLTR